jgi:uncharacterized protein (DUF433 family)
VNVNVKQVRALAPDDPRLARPLFTVSEAARYLSVPVSTLHNWARPPHSGDPLITVFDARGRHPTVPFLGFAEAFVLRAAQRAGVPEHRIRPGVDAIKRAAGSIEHALASKLVYTDGAEILFQELEEEYLTVARIGQHQFTRTVKNQLRLISYADDGYAARLRLPQYERAVVTIDPLVAAGRPLVESGGARVKDLIDRYKGGDTEDDIARDFAVPLEEVREIVGSA